MGIIIKNINGENYLYTLDHTPINLTPFTKPNAIEDFITSVEVGRIKDLGELEIGKEYNLDWINDFEIVERIPQTKESNNTVYYDLFFKLKTSKKL